MKKQNVNSETAYVSLGGLGKGGGLKRVLKSSLKALGLYSTASAVNRWRNGTGPYAPAKIKVSQESVSQVAVMNQYKLLAAVAPDKLPQLLDTGFTVYSQFDEDGILLYIFSLIGFTNRKTVEICGGSGWENNTANLIINHACEGLLFDGDAANIAEARKFFTQCPATFTCPPICKQAWLTKDNINQLIEEEGFTGSIDLLSLDVDGNDYYFWDAISVIQPRVFICEVHSVIPDDRSITIPYQEDFFYRSGKQHIEFRGASPLAMIRLSKRKGYRLIGAHKYGFNLIFMRNDVGTEYFPEVPLSSIMDNPYTIMRKQTAWEAVKDASWIEVEQEN